MTLLLAGEIATQSINALEQRTALLQALIHLRK